MNRIDPSKPVGGSVISTSFVDNYSLCEQRGKGAFSIVYKGISKKDDKEYAVKVMSKNRNGMGMRDLKRMETEVIIARRVQHPHIVSLHDVVETKLKLYLVMDLVDGGELFDQIIQKGSFSEKDAVVVLAQLLDAVHYLHENHIIHRDLKPENLLLKKGDKLHVMLSDFGLSRILGDESMASTSCGTPYYTAPEILQGHGYNKHVDMWSIGVITYFMLAGYPPFLGENLPDVINSIIHCRFSFPSPHFDQVSASAKDFISKLLVLEPWKRMDTEGGLKHPWISEGLRKDAPLEFGLKSVQDKVLKNFADNMES
eukprot:TRINITY_DN9210_c0_g1_i1.p1 TRINITY_DN9210_c0_g1~~TRINITY_DN9210_c0_g1_i1.p1  ORF type:complete len:325 (-),score=51.74 TRINITY_DN9210_c0_g1_i1:116-1054(-)